MRNIVVPLASLVSLTACGQASEQFDNQFADKFRESCIASSTQGGVPEQISSKICDCAVTRIDQEYSAGEKLGISPDDVKPILVECLNQAVQR